jgi:hypothetical protein
MSVDVANLLFIQNKREVQQEFGILHGDQKVSVHLIITVQKNTQK